MTISDEVIEAAAKKIAKEFDSDEGEMWDCFAIQFKSAAGAAIEAAVEAERECCAKIAEATKSYDDGVQQSAGCLTTGERIAAAIRNRKSGARENR